jgi:hypothetical protein
MGRNSTGTVRILNKEESARTLKRPKMTRKQFMSIGLAVALALVACDHKHDSASDSQSKVGLFTCQRSAVVVSGGQETPVDTRICEAHALDEGFYGPTFTTPIAYCFTCSKIVEGPTGGALPVVWGSATEDRCSPTVDECAKERELVTNAIQGPPPVKTGCHKEEF